MSKILQNCLVLMPAQCLAMMSALRPSNGTHEPASTCSNLQSDFGLVGMKDIKESGIPAGHKVNLFHSEDIKVAKVDPPGLFADKHVVRITGAGDPSNFADWTGVQVQSIVEVVLEEVQEIFNDFWYFLKHLTISNRYSNGKFQILVCHRQLK
jgi:hypothetical protein